MTKIDMGNSTCEEPASCSPSTAGHLEDIGADIRAIRELVSRFPQRPREPCTTRHSYVSRSNYEKYWEDQ